MKLIVILIILAMSIENSIQLTGSKTKSVVSFLQRIDCDSTDLNTQP